MSSNARRLAAPLLTAAALAGAALAPAAQAAPLRTSLPIVVKPTPVVWKPFPFNLAPRFNDYFTCLTYGGKTWVYTDFVDPYGDDAQLTVRLSSQYLAPTTMGVSTGYHGVFFYKELPAVPSGTVFRVTATDPGGLSSPTYTSAIQYDGSCSAATKL